MDWQQPGVDAPEARPPGGVRTGLDQRARAVRNPAAAEAGAWLVLVPACTCLLLLLAALLGWG